MRFVFQKQSRTVVHTVNLCAKRVQCSKRNTIEAVGSPINRVECSCENTSQPMQRRYARGNARNVPVGTHRDTRSVLSVTARGFSVSAHGPDLFGAGWKGRNGSCSLMFLLEHFACWRIVDRRCTCGVCSGEERTFPAERSGWNTSVASWWLRTILVTCPTLLVAGDVLSGLAPLELSFWTTVN